MITYCKNNCVLIQPVGRLDLQWGSAINQAIAEIQPECHQVWVIDLTKVDFVDSSGLTALVNLLNIANRHQCNFTICNPCPSVRLVLEITRLDQVFQIVDVVDVPEKIETAPKQAINTPQAMSVTQVASAA